MEIVTLMITYNRPAHTERVLNALRNNTVKPEKLFVFQGVLTVRWKIMMLPLFLRMIALRIHYLWIIWTKGFRNKQLKQRQLTEETSYEYCVFDT